MTIHSADVDMQTAHGADLHTRIVELLRQADAAGRILSVSPCGHGGNNRLYRVETTNGRFAVKQYFRHPSDVRDRLAAETAFLSYAGVAAPGVAPRLYAWDAAAGLALFEFIIGQSIRTGEVEPHHVEAAVTFFRDLNAEAARATAQLPVASEACFSLAAHLTTIDQRVGALLRIEPASDAEAAGAAVCRQLSERWREVAAGIRAGAARLKVPLDDVIRERCVSPSDFGFHNALIASDGRVRFVDFEYAGWDDPAKMIGDFFAQLAVPVPASYFDDFVERCLGTLPDAPTAAVRAWLLRSAYQIKWCCIALNVFLPTHLARRQFANLGLDASALKRAQLDKAERLMQSIDSPR